MNRKQKKRHILLQGVEYAVEWILVGCLLGFIFGHWIHLIWIIPVTCLLSWLSSMIRFGLLYCEIPAQSLVLKDETIVRVFNENTWMKTPEFLELVKGCHYYVYYNSNQWIKVKSGVKIVLGTMPVRLREVNYEAIIARPETPQGFLEAHKLIEAMKAKGITDFSSLGTYVCNEFNEAKYSEIATLYNPLDPDQSARFRSLFTEFLKEKLGPTNPFWVGNGSKLVA